MNELTLGTRLRSTISIDEVALKPKADLLEGEEVATIAVEKEESMCWVMMLMKTRVISVQSCHVIVA